MFIRIFCLFVIFSFSILSAKAEPVRFTSQSTQTKLVELYTSEGCSSCPPADRWLSDFKESADLWTLFVPIAFHVDYWDYIGWKDRFASSDYGLRQRQYAKYRGISTVYTPGVVLDGKEWRDWYRYKQPKQSTGPEVGRLQLVLNQGILDGEFRPVHTIGGELDLHIALLGFNLVTKVKAGENRNRSLQHDFVVLGYKIKPLNPDKDRYQIKTEIPESQENSATRALAAWVSQRDHPKPIQAVGGWLE